MYADAVVQMCCRNRCRYSCSPLAWWKIGGPTEYYIIMPSICIASQNNNNNKKIKKAVVTLSRDGRSEEDKKKNQFVLTMPFYPAENFGKHNYLFPLRCRRHRNRRYCGGIINACTPHNRVGSKNALNHGPKHKRLIRTGGQFRNK